MFDLKPLLPIGAAELKAEGLSLVEKAEKALAETLLSGSTASVRHHLAFMKLKHDVSYESLSRIARLLFEIFVNASGDVVTESRTASSLAGVLKLLNKLPDCPPPGSDQRLQLPWRPIYNSLLQVQHRGASWEEFCLRGGDKMIGAEASKQHHKDLFALVRRARNFFAPSAAKEILDELRPYLCPHEKSLYKASGLICLFLPDEVDSAGGATTVIRELGGVWQWIANSNEWNAIWITFFSRMARHNAVTGHEGLQELLPVFFSSLLRTMDLPTDKKTPQKQDMLEWPGDSKFLLEGKESKPKEETIKKHTRLIVYTLGPDSATFDHLQAAIAYMKPFFHPLQEGGHTKCMDMLLKMTTLNLAKRLGIEAGKHRPKKPWKGQNPISQEDCTRFTELFLPLAVTSLYSKDYSMSFGAAQALKDLSGISPELVMPQILDRVLPALENVMKPHEVQNSISLCAYIIVNILKTEDGLSYLGQVLQLTVNGVDTNDPMKTMYTLRLFNEILSQIPFMDPKDVPDGCNKPEMLYMLSEWLANVLDRLFELLHNIPDIKKGNPLTGHVSRILRRFTDVLFNQLSPTLYTQALEKVSRKSTESIYPPGKQFIGYVLDSIVYSNPQEGLQKLVPLLSSKIVNSKGEISGSEIEVSYFVNLLGHAVSRAGPALLQHTAQIDAVLNVTVMHEDEKNYKEAQKTLRKVLKSHLGVFPKEIRSLPPSKWGGKGAKDFGSLCGNAMNPNELEATFNAPTSACQARARELFDRFYEKATASAGEKGAAATSLRTAYGCLTNLVKGGASLLPHLEMQGFSASSPGTDEDDDETEEEGCAGLVQPLKVEDEAWGTAMREKLGSFLVAVCKQQALPDNPDVETLKKLVILVSVFLSCKGVWTKYGDLKQGVMYNKAVNRFWNLGPDWAYHRRALILRTHALLAMRMDMGVFQETPHAKELLEVIISLCTHEYALVRKKAQKFLPRTLKRYPRVHTRLYFKVVAKLMDPNATKAVITGAVHTIQKAASLKKIAKHFGLQKELFAGLLASHQFDETKVQVRLAGLWDAYVPYACPQPFGGLQHSQALVQHPDAVAVLGADVAKGVFDSGEKYLHARQERSRKTFTDLMETAKKVMTDGCSPSSSVHWRFTVLAAAILALNQRNDVKADKQTASLFLAGLNSDSMPLRQLCRAVVPIICLTEEHAVMQDGMEVEGTRDQQMVDAASTLTDPSVFDVDWEKPFTGVCVDSTWLGWNSPCSSTSEFVEVRKSTPEFSSAVEEITSNSDWMKGMLNKVSQDHRLSGDERAQAGSKAAAGMPIASGPVQATCATRWHYPRTSAAPFSEAYSKDNMLTFEALARAGGTAVSAAAWSELQTMAENVADREQQCTSAEVLAGLVRGSHCWSQSDNAAFVAKVSETFRKVLKTLPPESVGDWAECLRHIATNRDPRRMMWLSKVVSELPDAMTSESSSSTQVRDLKLQSALLMEQTWRGVTLASKLSGFSCTELGGSSKTVREVAGRGLMLISRLTMPTPRDSHDRPISSFSSSQVLASPLIQNFMPALITKLHTAYAARTKDTPEQEALALRNEIEGVLYFFIHACRLGQSSSVAAYLENAIPLILAVQEDSDKEFVHVGTITLELIATSTTQLAVAKQVCSAAEKVLTESASWRVRLAAVSFLRELAHSFILDRELKEKIIPLVDKSMGDSVPEVRQASCLSLAGLMRTIPDEAMRDFIARAPKPRRRGAKAKQADKTEEEKATALVNRHAKVLAVSAAILSCPTSLPEWMADAVTALSSLVDEEPMIRTSITKTVGDFRKSHQDVWDQVRATWSEDQLRLVQEMSGSQSYFS